MDGWEFLDEYDRVELDRADPARVVWCAGFFDGEGCITFGKDSYYNRFELVVSASQRYPIREPLNVFKDLFGGSISDYECTTNVGEARMFRWQISGFHAGGVLETMLPFLIVKREQAELAIQWVRLAPGSGNRQAQELKDRRNIIVEKIREAKRPWLRAV